MLSGQRFSLLLLEENEFYVKEFVVECRCPDSFLGGDNAKGRQGGLPGQLRLCTKSIFLEPDDVRYPIVRIPFRSMEELEGSSHSNSVQIVTSQWVTMKPGARDEPYMFYRGKKAQWSAVLSFSSLQDLLPDAQHMLLCSRLPIREQTPMQIEFIRAMENAQRFDVGNLDNPGFEKVVLEKPAMLVSRLTKQPGKFVLSDKRLYFQPLHNITGGEPVLSHALKHVATVARRRSSLKDVGLEVFFDTILASITRKTKKWNGTSAFFVFRTSKDREHALEQMLDQGDIGMSLHDHLGRKFSILEVRIEDGWLMNFLMMLKRRFLRYDVGLFGTLIAFGGCCREGQAQ